MTRFMCAVLATGVVLGLGRLAVADDQDASAVIDKAVKALGGAEKLGAAKSVEWKSKGKLHLNDNDNNFTTQNNGPGDRSLPAGIRRRIRRESDQGSDRRGWRQGLAKDRRRQQ